MGAKLSLITAAILATANAGPPLRYAAATNTFPNNATTMNLGTGCAQTDVLQNLKHIIGQDITSIKLGMTTQWLKAATGVSNVGNGLTVMEMAVVYNGVNVQVTSGAATTWTITDAANWLSDALASTSFGGATKFSKGTVLMIRARFRTSAPTTDKFPLGRGLQGSTEALFFYDPTKITASIGVLGSTSQVQIINTVWNVTSGSASGTTVTLILPTTANLINGSKYDISGATGTGNQLNYNATQATITVVDGTTITYTVASAPSATATGTLIVKGHNGIDGNSGTLTIPIMVLGNHTNPSVAILGDSKTHGTGDTMPANVNVVGMGRALFSDVTLASSVQCSGINMGCPSGFSMETFTATASGVVATFEQWYTYANYALVGYGTNNASTSDQTTLWGRLRAKGVAKIIQRSLTPRTSTFNSDPVSITSLTSSGTTCTATMADTSGLTTGQSYPISGATPAAYNGTFAITVVNGTTFTYTAGSAPGSSATGTIVLDDQWRTTKYQVTASGWSNGGSADTFETFCRTAVSTDANMTFYQSTGERASATVGSTGYWQWVVNGTAKYATGDGLHEGGTYPGYELNVGTGGTVTTQAGGTVSQTLRALVGTLT